MTDKTNPKAKASPKAKANPKAKKSTSVKKEKAVDQARFLNMGREVELSIGEYTFYELSAWDLTAIVTNSFEVFSEILSETPDDANDYKAVAKVLSDPNFKGQIIKIIGMYTKSEDLSPFESLRVSDFRKIINAVKEVTDFEEIKELFSELGLSSFLQMANQQPEA